MKKYLLLSIFILLGAAAVVYAAVAQTNPILVTGTAATSTKITDDRVTVMAVYWFSPDTVGHKFALQDKNGREVLELEVTTANESLLFDIPFDADGLYYDDMDSGAVYVYTKPSWF